MYVCIGVHTIHYTKQYQILCTCTLTPQDLSRGGDGGPEYSSALTVIF